MKSRSRTPLQSLHVLLNNQTIESLRCLSLWLICNSSFHPNKSFLNVGMNWLKSLCPLQTSSMPYHPFWRDPSNEVLPRFKDSIQLQALPETVVLAPHIFVYFCVAVKVKQPTVRNQLCVEDFLHHFALFGIPVHGYDIIGTPSSKWMLSPPSMSVNLIRLLGISWHSHNQQNQPVRFRRTLSSDDFWLHLARGFIEGIFALLPLSGTGFQMTAVF